jgi:hypothetical protein
MLYLFFVLRLRSLKSGPNIKVYRGLVYYPGQYTTAQQCDASGYKTPVNYYLNPRKSNSKKNLK